MNIAAKNLAREDQPRNLRENCGRFYLIPNIFGAQPFSDELHAISTFYRDKKGDVYHTYSTYARGVDMLNTAYHYLDLTAKGRDEINSDSSWVRHHDKHGG
jgi:predicted dithiol-disulfide oxidoreductase (DUF899 family)